jgi:nucleosome-remodeling factor subunit BPTF
MEGDVAPSDVAPSDVAPNDVAPSDVAPSDVAPSDVAPNDVAPSDGGAVTSPSTQDKTLISMQDVEYSEALRQDISRQELEKSMAFDELSPTSLRKKRLAYYQ